MTFLVVLLTDLLPAMVFGIVISIVDMVYRVSFPGREILGRVPETGDFVVTDRVYGHRKGSVHPEAQTVPGLIVHHFSGPLVFSNATAFTNTGEQLRIDAGAEGSLPRSLVIDFEEVFLVDDTGAEAITGLHHDAQRYGVDLALARVHAGTHSILELSGVTDEIGDRCYDTVRNAVDAVSQTPPVETSNTS